MEYTSIVLSYGVAITALAMALVAGWTTLFLTLIINFCSRPRRTRFRSTLIEYSLCFIVATILAVSSVVWVAE